MARTKTGLSSILAKKISDGYKVEVLKDNYIDPSDRQCWYIVCGGESWYYFTVEEGHDIVNAANDIVRSRYACPVSASVNSY